VAEVDFLLCVVAFLLLACVIVPVAAVAVLAFTGRKPSELGPGPYSGTSGEKGPRPNSSGLSLPRANGVR